MDPVGSNSKNIDSRLSAFKRASDGNSKQTVYHHRYQHERSGSRPPSLHLADSIEAPVEVTVHIHPSSFTTMASQPPQQSGASRRQDTTPDFLHAERRRPRSPESSESSEDSQTVLLNKPSTPSSPIEATHKPPPPQRQSSDDEPRKCWICFADETEDTPTSSAWRSPCPCALTAHESCLLDWVADLEAPTTRRRTGAPAKIQCPQCKSDIIIARPRSLVVKGVNAVERIAGRLVIPGIFVALAGSLLTGCWIHGLTTVYVVFGRDDFKHLMGVDSGRGISAKWGLGLPMIPLVLVLSRTSIADNVLPVLPILFFATHVTDSRSATADLWPPSAAMTIATLPYIRGIYNELYKRLFAEKEQRWIKEVQPRAGENTDENLGNPEQRANDGARDAPEANVGFELNLEVEIFEDIPNPPPGFGVNAPPADAQDQNQGNANANPAAQNPAPAPAPRQNNLIVSTSRVADTIIGALCFPVIASVMGQLIKVGLPRRITEYSGGRHRPGLLQTKWGRTILGGCLFVVMKDTLLLYSRYRIARDHRKRRVLDFGASKGAKS